MAFPTPYTVQREALVLGSTGGHGNAVESFDLPEDVDVHGWAPPSSDEEPPAAGRNEVVRDLDLYVPTDTESAPGDRWTVAGTKYLAVGHIDDYTHGPWQWHAGKRIKLKRVEG